MKTTTVKASQIADHPQTSLAPEDYVRPKIIEEVLTSIEPVTIPLTLTRDEWCEVANALDSKVCKIANGEFGPESKPGDNLRWMDTLKSAHGKVTKELEKKGVIF
jgi:hypothetical protein